MKKEYNCGFTNDNKWFRYRAAAIIVEGDSVLFAGNSIDDYYYSIGGAVHMGETAEDAVKREVIEVNLISQSEIHDSLIYGINTDKDGRCVHYHSDVDVIANKCARVLILKETASVFNYWGCNF